MEIARYRRFKVILIAAPRQRQIEKAQSDWSDYGTLRAVGLKREAERQIERLAKEKKTADEIEKLKGEIEAKLAVDIAEAETKGQANLEASRNIVATERDH